MYKKTQHQIARNTKQNKKEKNNTTRNNINIITNTHTHN